MLIATVAHVRAQTIVGALSVNNEPGPRGTHTHGPAFKDVCSVAASSLSF